MILCYHFLSHFEISTQWIGTQDPDYVIQNTEPGTRILEPVTHTQDSGPETEEKTWNSGVRIHDQEPRPEI